MSRSMLPFLYTLLLSALFLNCQCDERKTYIVYMGDQPKEDPLVAEKHHAMLQRVLGSYGKSFNGFAARLTEDEAKSMSEMEGVVSVNPNRAYKLHTTRSWDFLNLTADKAGVPLESDVIIGFLDTGVWPEHPSFNGKGYSHPPLKWKGSCKSTNFTCNNKIIGGRYYNSENSSFESDIQSPRDSEGHGTHTASTAAGDVIEEASYFGLAKGVARGGAPSSRIAVYKVCWTEGCYSADILKAFDDAIADGVDIISVSLGSPWADDYFDDPIAIGSFHAMRKGILTSNSAGNSGPLPATISNNAPWSFTVAASTIDRKFVARLQLGSGQVLSGITINAFHLNKSSYPLIWGGDAADYSFGSSPDYAKYCLPGGMNEELVSGKIVYCEALWDGSGILFTNGVGTIISDVFYVNPDFAFSWPLPATLVSPDDGKLVLEYIRSTKNPTATIFFSDELKDAMAPIVASFSSRGPNPISPDILKPDITAPGVDILAGWSPLSSPSVYDGDVRRSLFNIVSGTSMSCPHVSGAAALVKAAHPTWSPAAIKSALMTTAHGMDPRKHRDLEFAYGSGQINPVAAINPGLVFDATESDYVNFLCKQGYTTTNLRLVTGDNSTCKGTTPGRGWDLNYPSFSLSVEDGQKINGTFTRVVTNVGNASSKYTVSLYVPAWISVTVKPSVLSFTSVGETKKSVVKVVGPAISKQPIMSGAIVWSDGSHVVRAPLVVFNYDFNTYDMRTREFSSRKRRGSFDVAIGRAYPRLFN